MNQQNGTVIAGSTLIERNSDILAATVNNETVMMHIQSGHYYGLDDIGSEIWKRLESPMRFDALVDGLIADFRADREVITGDVKALLQQMAANGVVLLREGA